MNEIERVVKYIRSCREANIDVTITIDKRESHLILNALEKQLAVKPIIRHDNSGEDEDITVCGCCGMMFYYSQPYCDRCGKLVDWGNIVANDKK